MEMSVLIIKVNIYISYCIRMVCLIHDSKTWYAVHNIVFVHVIVHVSVKVIDLYSHTTIDNHLCPHMLNV